MLLKFPDPTRRAYCTIDAMSHIPWTQNLVFGATHECMFSEARTFTKDYSPPIYERISSSRSVERHWAGLVNQVVDAYGDLARPEDKFISVAIAGPIRRDPLTERFAVGVIGA